MKKALIVILTALLCLSTFSSCGKIISSVQDFVADKVDEFEENVDRDEKNEQEDVIDIGETKTISLSENAIYTGNLLTLNDTNQYKGTPELVNIEENRKANGAFISLFGNKQKFMATADTANALFKLVSDCNKALGEEGKDDDNLVLSCAYNIDEISTQKAIYSSGEAVAISCCYEGSTTDIRPINEVDKYKWIYRNAHKYGFIAVSSGSNEFRYVGLTHATAAKSKGLYLENYLKQLKNASIETPMQLNDSTIAYYCPINDVKVPKNYSYEKSGNNVDGVIITVYLNKSTSNNTENSGVENENAENENAVG